MSRQHQLLWYIAGAHMAQSIDEILGREVLLDTVSADPLNFFETYVKTQTPA